MKNRKPVTVKKLIEFLKTCKQDAVVYYTKGGSYNNAPVTYYEQDYNCFEISSRHGNGEGGILIGECTW